MCYRGIRKKNTMNHCHLRVLPILTAIENIEVPLRPINPDFTLDMEIKFAQLRNLIQSKVSSEIFQAKIIEIRQGLDESERLVTGTGIIAPAIAFSTSFTIIFREGLELSINYWRNSYLSRSI